MPKWILAGTVQWHSVLWWIFANGVVYFGSVSTTRSRLPTDVYRAYYYSTGIPSTAGQKMISGRIANLISWIGAPDIP